MADPDKAPSGLPWAATGTGANGSSPAPSSLPGPRREAKPANQILEDFRFLVYTSPERAQNSILLVLNRRAPAANAQISTGGTQKGRRGKSRMKKHCPALDAAKISIGSELNLAKDIRNEKVQINCKLS